MATFKTALQSRGLLMALVGLVLVFGAPRAHAESFLWDAMLRENGAR